MWKHDQLDQVQMGLLDQNIISIGGDIGSDTAMYVREALLRLMVKGSPPIKVLITSSGGSVRFGLDIYDGLKYYAGQKTGVVLGIAHSIAAVILQACDKRQCMRHSEVLIHHVSTTQVSLDSFRNSSKMTKIKEDLEEDQDRIYKILSKTTGKAVDLISAECAKNRSMNSGSALEFGLIDEVV